MKQIKTFGFVWMVGLCSLPAFGSSTPPWFTPRLCDQMLLQTGQLVDVEALREQLANMNTFFGELSEFHDEHDGTRPMAFSTPETASILEASHGPIISFTTFSRELAPKEYFTVTNHVLGLLSSLQQGGAIVASGGTMGNRGENGTGGGVGIIQQTAKALGFKTLSITAASAFKYRAAPADYILFSLGSFGSESQMMYRLSKALVVIGGGAQAYNEALEYLAFNPNGLLILIDDESVGGSSSKILNDPRFRNLANLHQQIIVARTGSEAGLRMAEHLGLRAQQEKIASLASQRLNVISPNADFHSLMPGSKIIGFSGWSKFSLAGPDVLAHASEISSATDRALDRIHRALMGSNLPYLYATAGNDTVTDESTVAAFENRVHALPTAENIRYLALSSSSMRLSELSERFAAISFVSPTWADRTQQFVVHVDAFVTSGGNKTVIDQAIQANSLNKPHIHILGANTFADMRIEQLKNPNLKCLTPDQIVALDDKTLLGYLGIQ